MIRRDLKQVTVRAVSRHHDEHVVRGPERRYVQAVIVEVAIVVLPRWAGIAGFRVGLVEDDPVRERQVDGIARPYPERGAWERPIVRHGLEHASAGNGRGYGGAGDGGLQEASHAADNTWLC